MGRNRGKLLIAGGAGVACVLLAIAAAVASDRPPEPPAVSPALADLSPADRASLDQFRCEVVPVLETRCGAGCHGVPLDAWRAIAESPSHQGQFWFPLDVATAAIPRDDALIRATWEIARGGGGSGHDDGVGRIAWGESADFSPLLRYPLAESQGGLSHRGLEVFADPDDAGYRALRSWIEAEMAAHPAVPAPLPEHVVFFRDEVLGVMERNSCFLGSCHGPLAFNDLKLEAPLPQTDARPDMPSRVSRRMLLHNRAAMLGKVCRMANLGGDLALSRLVVKNLPIAEGGVHQRGGNNQFFESLDDPDVRTLLCWLELEREALAHDLRAGDTPVREADLGRLQGVVFVRGPRHAPRRFFDFEAFHPGGDLWLLELAEGDTPETARHAPVNLTAALHPEGPVEIQSCDVRYDGRAVVFSMRRKQSEGFRLYEIELDGDLDVVPGSFRQVSFGPPRLDDGTPVHHVDPIYTPGPNDPDGTHLDDVAVAFASTQAGLWAASAPWGLLGEADFGGEDWLVDAQRNEPPGSLAGRRISFVDGPGEGEWRTIVAHEPDRESAAGSRLTFDRPLGFVIDRRSVYAIESLEADSLPAFDIWRVVPSAAEKPEEAWRLTARRMTFTGAQERRPTMRTSGETMFTSVRNVGFQGDRPVYNGAIFRVQAGGFDYHIHGGNRSRYPLLADSRELPSGLEIRLALDPSNLTSGGELLLVDHGFGVNIEPDNPMDDLPFDGRDPNGAAVRFLPTQVPLFSEVGPTAVTAGGRSPGGAFRDPFPLPDGRILVAHVSSPVDHLDPNADPDWDLYVLSFPGSPQSEDGSRAGKVLLTRLESCSGAGFAEYCPRPVVVRLKEKPVTHQKFVSRPNLPEPKSDHGVLRMPAGTASDVECYDYPLVEAFLTNFAPTGARRIRATVADGGADPLHELAFVRVLIQEPVLRADALPLGRDNAPNGDPFATRVSLGVHTRVRILAEVPLEADGSFYAAVPPETPFLVQGLNRERMALHSMNRWLYTQPGEKLTLGIPRSIFPATCGGCHGALTGDHRDQLGPPDVVSASSRVMANWNPETQSRRQPAGLSLTRADMIDIDFRRDIQPILDRRCVSCHGEQAAGGIDLRGTPTRYYTRSYEALLVLEDPASGDFAAKRYVNEREGLAIESYLMEFLLGRELDAPRVLESSGVEHPWITPLTDDEKLTLIRWIDLGATFLGPDMLEAGGDE